MVRRLLLAVDRSEHSAKAAAVAGDLARSSGGEIVVFHVREYDCEVVRGGPLSHESHSEAAEFVDALVDDFRQQGIEASGEARSAPAGGAAGDILELARARQADFIVIGSRGMSSLGAFLLGSVASAVIRQAECPVVVAHRPDVMEAGGGLGRRLLAPSRLWARRAPAVERAVLTGRTPRGPLPVIAIGADAALVAV